MTMAEQELIRGQLPETLSWEGPEYHHHEKDDSWNKGLFLVAVLLILFALWQRNFLFLVFIVLATWLLSYFGHRKPDTIEFMFDARGFITRGIRKEYRDLDGFAIKIDDRPGALFNKLIIRTKSHFTPHLVIPIEKKRTAEIRTFLTEYLSEIDHEDSMVDVLADFFKF